MKRRVASAVETLGEAAEWRLLSLLLSRPTAERKHEVVQLSDEVALDSLRAAARAWTSHAEEGPYLQLLGPGGIVAARAVAYRPFADPGWTLADIARCHEAFGFRVAAEEPPDHIAVLADFVAYLLLKEAYARECGDEQSAALTCGARQRFIDEHLVPAAARLADRLEACGAQEWAAPARMIAERIPAPSPVPAAAPVDEPTIACSGCTSA